MKPGRKRRYKTADAREDNRMVCRIDRQRADKRATARIGERTGRVESVVLCTGRGRRSAGSDGAIQDAFAVNVVSCKIIFAGANKDGCADAAWPNAAGCGIDGDRADGNRGNGLSARVRGIVGEVGPRRAAVGGNPKAAVGAAEIDVAIVVRVDGEGGHAS